MDRKLWRETRRAALILLLLFITSGAALLTNLAARSDHMETSGIGTDFINRLYQNDYYDKKDAALYNNDLYQLLRESALSLSENRVYADIRLYQGDMNTVIAASGNYICLWFPEGEGMQQPVYVALDEAVSSDQAAEMISNVSNGRGLLHSVIGYLDGSVLYPTQLTFEIFKKKRNWKTLKMENETTTKTYSANSNLVKNGKQTTLFRQPASEYFGTVEYSALLNDLQGSRHIYRSMRAVRQLAQEASQYYDIASLSNIQNHRLPTNNYDGNVNILKNQSSTLQCLRQAKDGKPALYLAVNAVSYPLYDALCDYGASVAVMFFVYLCVFVALITRKFWYISREQSRAAQRQRDFTNALAHEMKTPLGIIRGYSELMQEHIAPEKHPAYLTGIIGETEHVDALVAQILSFSRIDTHHMPMHPASFALDDLIRRQLEEFQPLVEKKQILLTVDVPAYLYLNADEQGISLVLRNLVSNAIKYVPREKKVEIRACADKRRVTVAVFNQGEPISATDMPYLWDAFYRADEARTRENGGSGMGLAIAKAVLERHGARYGVSNQNEGVEFWFSLPV